MNYPKKVKIVEVGPRDGLQNEKEVIPTDAKIKFIDLLSESGLSVIETTSFVHPKWVPQLADAAEVYANIQKKKGVSYPVLVPNEKGMERALQTGVKDVAVFTAISETFNQKNINMSVEDSLVGISKVMALANAAKVSVRGYVSTCFVCPYEGKVSPEKVLPVVDRLLAMGIREVSIGDTIGGAVPADVEALFAILLKKVSPEKLAVHFHDTHGTAIANMVKSLEMGLSIVDSSAGGLGGCPYAPGASGNVATEAVLEKLQSLGIETGVDLQKIREASRFMGTVLRRPSTSRAS